MCECSFQFRLWSINFETLSFDFVHAVSPRFRQYYCYSNSSVTVIAEHEIAKSSLSIGIPFRQSFTQIRLPSDIRYNAVIIALIESFTRHVYVVLLTFHNYTGP